MEFACLSILFAAAVILIFISWRSGKKRINDIFLGKTAALGRWEYTPEEWKIYSARYFPWVGNKDLAGIFSIAEDAILISNGRDELFLDLTYKHILAHIEYNDDSSVFHIKLKKLKRSTRFEKIYYDGYQELEIPLPPGNAEKANRIVEQFEQIAREDFEATRSMASSDLIFGYSLNTPPDNDEFENEADEKVVDSSET